MTYPKGYSGGDYMHNPFDRHRDPDDPERPRRHREGDGGKEPMSGRKKVGIIIGIAIVIIIVGMIAMAGFRTVESGTVGLKTTFGQVHETTLTPGMHIVNPFADNVIPMSIRVSSITQDAGAASKDLQDEKISVTVNSRINPESAVTIFKTLGLDYAVKIINPRISESVKAVSAKFNAGELITQRETVRTQIETLLRNSLESYNILVTGVTITNFAFSQQFTDTIEQSQVARQQLVTQQNVLEKVRIDAQQKIVNADANKNATIAEAEGQAEAIRLIQVALASSPNYVEYQKVNKWDGILPKVSDGQGGNIINLPDTLLSNSTN